MAERICGELGETSFVWNIPASRENSNNLRISFQTSSVDGTVEIGSQRLCSKLMTILSTLTALPNQPMIQGENHHRTIPHPNCKSGSLWSDLSRTLESLWWSQSQHPELPLDHSFNINSFSTVRNIQEPKHHCETDACGRSHNYLYVCTTIDKSGNKCTKVIKIFNNYPIQQYPKVFAYSINAMPHLQPRGAWNISFSPDGCSVHGFVGRV